MTKASDAPLPPSPRLDMQVWLLRALTAVAVLLALSSYGWFQWLEREQEIGHAIRQAERGADRLAEELEQALALAKVAIAQSEARLRAAPAQGAVAAQVDPGAAERSQLLAVLPLAFELHAIDATGRVVNLAPASAAAAQPALHVHQRPSPDAPAGVWQIGTPQSDGTSRVLPFVRRAAPNPHGVDGFAIDVSHAALLRRLEASRDPQGGSAALFRVEPDGSATLLARAPHLEGELGLRVGGPLTAGLARSPQGHFQAVAQLDGVRRTVAYRRLAGDAAGLVVLYGFATDSVLDDWYAHLAPLGAVTLLLCAGMLAGSARLERSLREQAAAHQAARRSEEHFRLLATNIPDVVARLDRQGRHLYVNPAVERATGVSPEAFIGRTNAELGMDAASVDLWMACLQRVLASGRTERLEFSYEAAGAVRHWESQVAPEPDARGQVQTVLVISRDISERRQRDEELRRLHATLGALVDGSTDAIFVKDRDGRYIVCNRALAALLGREVSGVLGADDTELFPADWAGRLRADDQRLMREGACETREESIAMPGGTREQLTTKGALVIDGEVRGVFGIARDVTERRRAERALRLSEERLRLALEAANQGLYDLDLRSGSTVVSPEYARMLGYDPDRFTETAADWRERLHPDDRERVYGVFEDYLAGRLAEYRVEFRQRTRDGGWKWILSLGKVQERDADGRPLRMLGTHTDITAIKQAQADLGASETRYRHLFEHNPAPMLVYACDGLEVLAVNESFTRQYGFEPAQARTLTLDALHVPEQRQAVRELAARLNGLVDVGEWQHLTRDGRRMAVTARSHDLRYDGRAARVVVMTDVTERRRAEDAVRGMAAELEQRVRERTAELARSEARLRTIFETVPVAIGEEDWTEVQRAMRELRAEGVTDGPGYFASRHDFVQRCLRAVKVVRLNQKALSMHDAHDAAGELTSLQAFYPAREDLPQFVGELEALWSGQRLYTAKKSLPSMNGRPLSLMMTMSLPGIDDEDGTALVCLVDISEVDRLNAELDRSVARLRQVNQELETFTYSVSHDLKAPLRGIDGYSRLLLEDHQDQLDPEGREFLGHIRRATQHMAVLIDDLLSYSRLERRELTLTRLPLQSVVDGVLAPFRADIEARGVQLGVQLEAGLCVLGDAQGLAIALRNLVDNALKFGRHSHPPRIDIVGTRSGDAVRLSVRDNGLGFDMKFHDRIFSIFQRLHRAEDYPGTGVGLAIVRKAMQRMGGRAWAESTPGQGAVFVLELPEAA